MRAAYLLLLVACAAAPVVPPAPPATDWERVHELIDLFDTARVTRDPDARARLLAALGTAADTDAVIDALLVRVDRVLETDRLHAGAQAARTLLEDDRRPPADRRALYLRMTALKSIARGNGPMAPGATLRLALFCAAAFRDAVTMVARERPTVLSSCLYPLFDTDPAPYFDPDPARRPPAPAWADLDEGLRGLLAALAKGGGRLAPLAARLEEQRRRLVADADPKGLLPRPLDPRALRVPEVAAAPPFDWEPLIFVAEPTPAELARFEKELGGLLAGDGRGRVALVLGREAPASAFLPVAALARRLGAGTVELAVGYTQTFRAPPGDYAAFRTPGGTALRLGVLPLGSPDPARAGLGLVLAVAPKRWQLVSPTGAMAPIPVGADAGAAAAALKAQLAELLDAFPDEAALQVAPDPDVSIGALATAIDAARARIAELGLATSVPAARGDLAARAARRAAARVSIAPDALAAQAPGVRRCYQDALDRAPTLTGTLELGAGLRVVSGPADEALRRCVVARLRDAAAATGAPEVRVQLYSR